jgi:hypothetical protein
VSAVSDGQPYKSALSDEHWALIEPVITAWKARYRSVSGHQGSYEVREIVNVRAFTPDLGRSRLWILRIREMGVSWS